MRLFKRQLEHEFAIWITRNMLLICILLLAHCIPEAKTAIEEGVFILRGALFQEYRKDLGHFITYWHNCSGTFHFGATQSRNSKSILRMKIDPAKVFLILLTSCTGTKCIEQCCPTTIPMWLCRSLTDNLI